MTTKRLTEVLNEAYVNSMFSVHTQYVKKHKDAPKPYFTVDTDRTISPMQELVCTYTNKIKTTWP